MTVDDRRFGKLPQACEKCHEVRGGWICVNRPINRHEHYCWDCFVEMFPEEALEVA